MEMKYNILKVNIINDSIIVSSNFNSYKTNIKNEIYNADIILEDAIIIESDDSISIEGKRKCYGFVFDEILEEEYSYFSLFDDSEIREREITTLISKISFLHRSEKKKTRYISSGYRLLKERTKIKIIKNKNGLIFVEEF